MDDVSAATKKIRGQAWGEIAACSQLFDEYGKVKAKPTRDMYMMLAARLVDATTALRATYPVDREGAEGGG